MRSDGNGDFTVLTVIDHCTRHHFHFEVGAGQRELAVAHLCKQVGQHRQGLPAFDHVGASAWMGDEVGIRASMPAMPLVTRQRRRGALASTLGADRAHQREDGMERIDAKRWEW